MPLYHSLSKGAGNLCRARLQAMEQFQTWIYARGVGPQHNRSSCYSTNSAARFHMPYEGLRHTHTLVAWPDVTTHPQCVGYVRPNNLDLARRDVASVANAIAEYEPLWLYAKQRNLRDAANAVIRHVTVKRLEVEQLWTRDTGPIFVVTAEGDLVGIDTNLNYWGDKNSISKGTDPVVAKTILELGHIPRVQASIVLEGGGVEFDGKGTLLATESSMPDPNRNPGMSKCDIHDVLTDLFGVGKIIWLQGAKGIDITDSHVDALARFGPGDTVILSRPNDAISYADPLYGGLQASEVRLESRHQLCR